MIYFILSELSISNYISLSKVVTRQYINSIVYKLNIRGPNFLLCSAKQDLLTIYSIGFFMDVTTFLYSVSLVIDFIITSARFTDFATTKLKPHACTLPF